MAALNGLVAALLQRLRPGLARQTAIASCVDLLAITERGGQIRVEPAAGRHRARDVLAGIAMAVESHLRGRALAVTNLLVLGKLGRHRRIGNREIVAVAGAPALRRLSAEQGEEAAALAAQALRLLAKAVDFGLLL